ncbi:hypothetical protein TUBRATIS_26510 [Tubulinosema ratisbonensis]|uniref:Uncharacterized protein n=1 Tax=Tubulinosema ratisbonensis TaxID=291195 RepID=A0A437AIA8_9MICR|nr:hypothetical protein TUBRATIS_26510 [Tubulinosema ratisbonensis]
MVEYLILLLILIILIIIYITRLRRRNTVIIEESNLKSTGEDNLIIQVVELFKFLTDKSFFRDGKLNNLLKRYFNNKDKGIIEYLKENIDLQLISCHKSSEIFKFLIYNSVKENGFNFDFYNNFYFTCKSSSDPVLVQRFLAYSPPKRSFNGCTEILVSPLVELEYFSDMNTSLKKYAMINNLRSLSEGPLFLVVILKNLVKSQKIDLSPINFLFFLKYNLHVKVFFKGDDLKILKKEEEFKEEGFYVSMLIYKREVNENFLNIN